MAELKRARLILFFCLLLFIGQGGTAAANNGWTIRINIPASTLELLRAGQVWYRFPVAFGKASTPTPLGRFVIEVIIENPTWYPAGRSPIPPGVNNPLGRYWLGLSLKGYGIHGNNDPLSIGNPISNGCIRMHNRDVEFLAGLVRVGTPVEIVYQTVQLETAGDKVWLTLYPDYYQRFNRVQDEILTLIEPQVLPYPVHWDGLWWLLEDDRPQVIELPRQLHLVLDGTAYPETAFFWGNWAFLPATLSGLWGEASATPYIELVEFMRTRAGQVYAVFDQQKKVIHLHTLRIYYQGRLFGQRGWFRDEPYIPRALTELLTKEYGPPDRTELLRANGEEEDRWIPLSTLMTCWPELEVNFDAEEWVLTLGL
ncbi:MAG: L,D-transpeptidase [Firmicutes bacterium]|nr:L,D-transpeptidase [Bacillota bacterium]